MAKLYGKINCLTKNTSNTASDIPRAAQELYVGMFKFLEYLQTQGETELVTYFSGASAQGTGKDYWDTANAAGQNAFSVWKMKANENRNWDWYLYIHSNFDQANFQAVANSTPTRIMGNAALISTDSRSYLLSQAAFSISGSASINPWNGTINLSGSASKTSPVWSTGSSGYTVHVFPRINNLSGSASTEKDVCANIKSNYATNGIYNFRQYYSFMYDGHGLLFFCDTSSGDAPIPRQMTDLTYIGPFKLIDGIKRTGLALGGQVSGSYGFCMVTTNYAWANTGNGTFDSNRTSLLPEYTDIGALSNNQSSFQGGVFGSSDVGVRTFQFGNDNTFLSTTYYPNNFLSKQDSTNISFDEKTYNVFANEVGNYSALGILDTIMIRGVAGDLYTYDISPDKKRMVLSLRRDNNTARRITVPWDGTTQPIVSGTRDGVTFSNPNYTW